MNKVLTFFAVCVLSCAALSATPGKDKGAPKAKAQTTAPQEQAPAPPPAVPAPTGPMGLLALKVGMTKEAVEALTANDEVFLTEPLVENPQLSKAGQRTWYKGKLKSPLSPEAVPTTMVFDTDGVLTYFSLDLSEATLDGVEKQLAAKYGAAKIEEKSDEEQCIYKNGANFKLPNKNRRATWSTPYRDSSKVVTSVSIIVMAFCPGNLRYGSVDPIKLTSLSFSRVDPKPEAAPPKKDLF